MAKITKEAALLYHSQGKPGKIEVVPTKPYQTQRDLSLAIHQVSPSPVWKYRNNLKPHTTIQQKAIWLQLSPTVQPY